MDRPEALARARSARASLVSCRLCAFRCGVDRTQGPAGVCRTDARSRVFHEGVEWAGEEDLVPTYVISLSGCNMSCGFCLTGALSQNGAAGRWLDMEGIASRIRSVPGLRSVTLLGGEPTIHLDGALEIAARVPRSLTLVWKTNATASDEGMRLLSGIPDVVLADFKFGNDDCAKALGGIPHYVDCVVRNLEWAAKTGRLIVRHLLMPGHVDCCLVPVAERLSRDFPGVPFSLMTGYLPTWRAAHTGTNSSGECDRAAEVVRSLGLRTMPWTMRPGKSPLPTADDEIWIDRNGRLCMDSASADLLHLLKRMDPGVVVR